jgi:hypothetical protein
MGPAPVHWYGTGAVDGDATAFARAPKGSTYERVDLTNRQSLGHFTKTKEDSADNDWIEGLGVINETVAVADFTDGGAAVGTYVLKRGIPAGAFVLRTVLVDVTGFTGDTSATIQVGDGTDVDRYSTGTPSVFTTAVAIDLGAVSGTAIHTAASTPILTVTSASDWGAVAAGSLTIRIYYYA